MINFSEIIGFDWDDGNRDKNALKHNVSWFEAEEIFFNYPVLIRDDKEHTKKEERYYALGKTNSDRRLFISFIIRKNKIRIISARDMNKKELIYYERAEKNTKI